MLSRFKEMLLFLNHILIYFSAIWFLPHPYYLSVTELKYNEKAKSIEVSCKMFTNDLEMALRKTSGKTVDLLHPQDKAETDKILFEYITKRLTITNNNQKQTLKYIGFEKEEDAIWTYMEISNCQKPKSLLVTNKLLYDFLKEQINIVHLECGSLNESNKVTNPDSKIEFKIN